MEKFLTEETPAKVLSLIGAAMASMFFLFAVTATNASFQKTEVAFPDPFGPAKVMAVLDVASNSYAKFLAVNLINPASQQYQFVADNVGFIADNAGPQIAHLTGYDRIAAARVAYVSRPQVAGAYTQVPYSKTQANPGGVLSFNYLYSVLLH